MNNSTARLTVAGNNQRKAANNQSMMSIGQSNGNGRNNQLAAIIIGLVVVALLWVLGNYIYNYYTANQKSKVIKSVILGSPHNGQTEFDIGSSELANSSYSNEYSISFWMYVDDYSYRQGLPKFVMRRGNIKTGVNPEIYLDPSVNMLRVNVSMMGNSQVGQMAGPEAKTTTTSGATTTTSGATTTTSGATTTTEPFTNMPRMDGETNTKNDSSDFISDSAAAPGLIANPHNLLDKLNDNSAHIPDIYDSSYFGLISGNEVGSINQSGVELKHNPELNVVLEQFGPTNEETCECPDDKLSAAATAAERAEFEAKAGKCMVQAFPLQKWVHVVVSQYNQVLDLYIDGKLSSSCVLPGFPDVVQDDLVIAPEDGFSGKITKVVYLNSAVSADDAYALYADGPDFYETVIARIPNWGWAVLALVILAVLVYSFV